MAYNNPGEEQAIDIRFSKAKRIDFFHYQSVQKWDQTIIFKDNRFEIINNAGEKYGEVQLAVYVILLLMAIFLMILSNVFKRVRLGTAFATATVVENEDKVYKVYSIAFYILTIISLFI